MNEIQQVFISKREIAMSLVRSARSLNLVKSAYEGNGELVITSLQVRKGQKELLEGLAALNSMSQASVLRTIIDEWCEMKLVPVGT